MNPEDPEGRYHNSTSPGSGQRSLSSSVGHLYNTRFEAGVWSVFVLLMFFRGYVESYLNLGEDSEARFGQDFEP